ncbi:hypothetical protein ABIC45_002134 [Mucilaginibacter rubeus]|uniref:DUF6717 family protein n=1 Tax=Mucilaginibacter rubeus TaxID=2027860 RepID=UPI00347DA286
MTTAIHTYKFIKEDNGRWYIDLPDWQGVKADLEMVEGADTMLDYVGEGSNEVKLLLAEEPFEGSGYSNSSKIIKTMLAAAFICLETMKEKPLTSKCGFAMLQSLCLVNSRLLSILKNNKKYQQL